jgi:hypothetical protein
VDLSRAFAATDRRVCRKTIQTAIESFNSRLCDECLKEQVFGSLDAARHKVEP